MPSYATATQIIDAAFQELGLGASNIALGAADPTTYQAVGLLNALGNEVNRSHDWTQLTKQFAIYGDGATTDFSLPGDFARQVNQTQWAASSKLPMLGPTSPQMWAWLQYGLTSGSAGVQYQYKLSANDKFSVFPAPAAGEVIQFTYISSDWVYITNVGYTNTIENGDVFPLLDARLMIAGLKFKLWAAKGMDTTMLAQEYNFILQNEKQATQGAREISLTGYSGNGLLGFGNVPETGFGL